MVAAEQLSAGGGGMPTMQFSRRWTVQAAEAPALGGTTVPRPVKTPIIAAVRDVASVRLRPHG